MALQVQLKCDFCATLTPLCASDDAARTWALANNWVIVSFTSAKASCAAWCHPDCQTTATVKALRALAKDG